MRELADLMGAVQTSLRGRGPAPLRCLLYVRESTISVAAAVSATATSGLSVGITSPSMPTGLKLVYMFQVWAGRLEFIAVLELLAQAGIVFGLERTLKR